MAFLLQTAYEIQTKRLEENFHKELNFTTSGIHNYLEITNLLILHSATNLPILAYDDSFENQNLST